MTGRDIRKARAKLGGEEWCDIPGLSGYQASSLGQIRSVTRLKIYKNGGVRWLRGRTLKHWITREGYPQVELSGRSYSVHRLVLTAFVGPQPFLCECAHNDGNRKNCQIDNLRWTTRSDNHTDKLFHGTMFRPRGILAPSAKLTEEQIREIRAIGRTRSQSNIAAQFGISQSHVGRILNRRQWQ